MAQPAKRCDNFIRDIKDVMCTTNIERPFVITLWWNDHAARTQDRFGDKTTNVVCTNAFDHLLEVSNFFIAPFAF